MSVNVYLKNQLKRLRRPFPFEFAHLRVKGRAVLGNIVTKNQVERIARIMPAAAPEEGSEDGAAVLPTPAPEAAVPTPETPLPASEATPLPPVEAVEPAPAPPEEPPTQLKFELRMPKARHMAGFLRGGHGFSAQSSSSRLTGSTRRVCRRAAMPFAIAEGCDWSM